MSSNDQDFDHNALIDNELSPGDKKALIARALKEPSRAKHLSDLRITKELVASTYSTAAGDLPSQNSVEDYRKTRHPIMSGCVAAFFLATGWFASDWYNTPERIRGSHFVSTNAAALNATDSQSARLASDELLLFHIDHDDLKRFDAALDAIETLFVQAKRDERLLHIELVANAKGVKALDAENRMQQSALIRLMRQYPNFKVRACSRTLSRLAAQGESVRLAPYITTDNTALDQIVHRLKQGWQYIRI